MAPASTQAVLPRFLLPTFKSNSIRGIAFSPFRSQSISERRLDQTSGAHRAFHHARPSSPTYRRPQTPPTPRATSPPRSESAIQVRARRAFTDAILPSIQSRAFSATSAQARDHHFDTLKFVQRLKDEGFSEEQAVAMMRVLSDVIEERLVEHTPTPTSNIKVPCKPYSGCFSNTNNAHSCKVRGLNHQNLKSPTSRIAICLTDFVTQAPWADAAYFPTA
jgi:hypothetical protein